MFLFDESYRLKNFGYYVLGSFILIIFSTIGQIPLLFFLPTELPAPDASAMDLFKDIPSNLRLFLILISFVFVVPAIWLVVKKLHDLPIMSILSSRKKIDLQRVLYSFMIWAAVVTSFVLLEYFISPENYQVNFNFNQFIVLAIIAILLIPIQTSVEEIVFRGYLMQGFGNWFNSRLMALLLTSIVFGSLHLANPEIGALGYEFIVFYIAIGLVLGIMTLMDEGIELALGFHAANNLCVALLVTSDWTAFQTASLFKDVSDPELVPDLVLFLGIIYPITLYYLAKKYNWQNWKYKLTARINEE